MMPKKTLWRYCTSFLMLHSLLISFCHSWNDFFKHEVYDWDSEETYLPHHLLQQELESTDFRKQFISLTLSWTDNFSRYEPCNTSVWLRSWCTKPKLVGAFWREASPWIHSSCRVSKYAFKIKINVHTRSISTMVLPWSSLEDNNILLSTRCWRGLLSVNTQEKLLRQKVINDVWNSS